MTFENVHKNSSLVSVNLIDECRATLEEHHDCSKRVLNRYSQTTRFFLQGDNDPPYYSILCKAKRFVCPYFSLNLCSAIYLHKLVRWALRGFLISQLLLIGPVNISFCDLLSSLCVTVISTVTF